MVDRMAKGKRTASRKEVAGAPSPVVPRFASSPRIGLGGGLTPAGQKLAGKMGNLTTPKRMGFGGSGSIAPKGGQGQIAKSGVGGGVVRRSGLRQESSLGSKGDI